MRWPPIYMTRRAARVGRGQYQCAGYETESHVVRLTEGGENNVFVDHVVPVGSVDSWDNYMGRLFCGPANLQVLCRRCHNEKTQTERRNNRGER